MTKANKAIVVVVFCLVILFGIGQFFAGSNLTVAPPSQSGGTGSNGSGSGTSGGQVTQVVTYVPPRPGTSTPVESGSCWTNSIAAAYRADAWRCTVGNSISDPCFEIPGAKTLLCGVDPAKEHSTSTFVLKLTKPLPKAQIPEGPVPVNWGWLVELSGGTLCTPFTGTRPFTADQQAANYGCAPGPLGNDVMIFNDINASSEPWLATVGTLTAPTSGLPSLRSSSIIPVSVVWQ